MGYKVIVTMGGQTFAWSCKTWEQAEAMADRLGRGVRIQRMGLRDGLAEAVR